MNRETEEIPEYGEYKKNWNDTVNAEEERRACLKDLFSRAEVLWRLMRTVYAVTDCGLLAKLDDLKKRSVYPDPGIPVTCAECGRAYAIRDTLRPACAYCGSFPSGAEGRIPFDGASLFAPFPEWLRGTEHTFMAKTADISFSNPFIAKPSMDFHPAGVVLKGLSALVMPIPIHIGGSGKSGRKGSGTPQREGHSVNYAPLLDRYCSVIFSIWEIFREKTDSEASSLAEEIFRLLDKLASEPVPSEHRPPFEYLSVLTDSVRNIFIAAVSLTEADFAKMSDSLAETRSASHANEPAPICRVCGRPIQSLKSGPAACIYCGTKIEQDPAAYLFRVRFV